MPRQAEHLSICLNCVFGYDCLKPGASLPWPEQKFLERTSITSREAHVEYGRFETRSDLENNFQRSLMHKYRQNI